MTQQTWEKFRERKRIKDEMNVCRTQAKKIELQKTYAEKNREVKRSARNDQRNYIDNLAYLAEEATRKGNLKELLTITKVLSKRQIQRNRPIRAIDGTLLTNQLHISAIYNHHRLNKELYTRKL